MHRMEDFRKILIIKPSSLGDVIHAMAFLHAVKECTPAASIHWVIARGLEDLVEGHPLIERVWTINKDEWKRPLRVFRTAGELRSLAAALRSERFDLVVDLQGLMRSGMIARFTGAPVIVGFSEAREGSRFMYTHRVAGGRDIHAVDRYLKVAEYLGCRLQEVHFALNPAGDFREVAEKYGLPGDFGVLIPGARWKTKLWPAERFAEVARGMPVQAIILGSGADVEVAGIIEKASNGRAVSLAGRTTLRETMAIIGNARFVLTNDTGPMHMAAAAGVPVYAIFGPTSEVLTGPYGNRKRVFRAELECAPCFRRKCSDIRCMQGVSAAEVLDAILMDISQGRNAGRV